MINKIKYISIFILTLSIFACNSDDNDFSNDINTGWVEFQTESTDVLLAMSNGIVSIPFSFNVPVSKNDTKISYELVPVSGSVDPNTLIKSNSTTVSSETFGLAVNDSPNLVLDITQALSLTSKIVFDVVLTKTDNTGITIGINGTDRITTHRVSLCPTIISSTYSGDAYSLDLDQAPGGIPAYTVNFVPVMGEVNTWDLATTWGPDYVNNTCGGCVPPGSFPYPSRITLNDDNTITVVGGANYASGGTGTYDPCSNTFNMLLEQALFGNPFKVTVDFTAN